MEPSEKLVGIGDYLAEMERVDSVVGISSANECTYSQGVLDRQAVYSCLDCAPPPSGIMAGLCYACSLHCHRDHNIEEIYTKRDFRCDCGTIPQLLCNLKEQLDTPNTSNTYSQNVAGLYCECSRPFPDDDRPEMEDVEMVQCLVCEDWFHATHLHTLLPEVYGELVCGGCAGKHPWLEVYALAQVSELDVMSEVQREETASVVAVSEKQPEEADSEPQTLPTDEESLKRPVTEVCDFSPERPSKRQKSSGPSTCKLHNLSDTSDKSVKRALFFDDQLRSSVCKCHSCLEMYKNEGILFITNPDDTLAKYEERAQSQRDEQSKELDRTIEKLPHQAKCEVARSIGSLKNTIADLLKKAATEGEGSLDREKIKEAFMKMAAENNVNPSVFDNM